MYLKLFHIMMVWKQIWKNVHPKFFQNPFLGWPWVVLLGIKTWSAIGPFYLIKSLQFLEKITNLLHIFTMKKAWIIFFFIGPYGRSSANAQPDRLPISILEMDLKRILGVPFFIVVLTQSSCVFNYFFKNYNPSYFNFSQYTAILFE